jgi:kinesin family protein 20
MVKALNSEQIKVFVRIRPIEKKSICSLFDFDYVNNCIELKSNDKQVSPKLNSNRKFIFSKVLSGKAKQDSVFEEVVLPFWIKLIEQGLNMLIFTYGVTNAGKTFTVVGSPTDPGILKRSLLLCLGLKRSIKQIRDVSKFKGKSANLQWTCKCLSPIKASS